MSLDEWLGYPSVRYHKGLNLRLLPMNHAYVVANTSMEDVIVYEGDKNCFHCPYVQQVAPIPGQETAFMVDSRKSRRWRIERRKGSFGGAEISPDDRQGWLCQMAPTIKEFGVYRLDIGRCELQTEVPPANTALPLILCSLILLGVYLTLWAGKFLWSRRKKNETKNNKALEINISEVDDASSSIDIFRGILLSLIIFVTTGGGGYKLFLRSQNSQGLSFAECLYFAFAWSVGLKIPTSMNRAFHQQTKRAILKDMFLRLLVLIFLDIAIASAVHRSIDVFTPEELWRPMLRLGIAYFVAATAYVTTVQKFEMKSKKIICKAISNLISLMWCWIISGFFLAIIAILMSTLISFNCLGNLEMTSAIDFSEDLPEESLNCNNGLSMNVNVIMLNAHEKVVNLHNYLGFSQGIMGTMSTIMFTMIGLKAGVIYANYKNHIERLKLWTVWAALFGLGGVFFGAISYPLEFNLWPISTILLTSTVTMIFFAALYCITEVTKYHVHLPALSSLGATSLLIIPGHVLFSYGLPFTWFEEVGLGYYVSQHMSYIIYSYSTMLLWLLIGVLMMRRKIRFSI